MEVCEVDENSGDDDKIIQDKIRQQQERRRVNDRQAQEHTAAQENQKSESSRWSSDSSSKKSSEEDNEVSQKSNKKSDEKEEELVVVVNSPNIETPEEKPSTQDIKEEEKKVEDLPNISSKEKSSISVNFNALEDMGDMMDDDLDDFESDHSEPEGNSHTLEVPKQANMKTSASQITPYDVHRKTLALLADEEEEEGSNIEKVESIIERKLSKGKSSMYQPSAFIEKAEKSLSKLSKEEFRVLCIELLHERLSLKEKLKIAREAIMDRDSQIQKLKSQSSTLPLQVSNRKLHLAFLFSSPLVRKSNSKMENIMQLDYLSEISDIVKVCSQIPFEMKYKTDVATVSNIRSTITDCPVALHFSGHGIENTPENLGNDFFLTKNKGNILLLEDEQGMSDYFFEDDLKYMVEVSQNATLEVVFVSSCYSQFAGEVFLNAGAKHVICIRSGERISDKASLRFSRVFYETLFVKNYNVCTSFKIAKEEINKVIGSNEASKFLLLVQPEKSYRSTESHKCYVLSDFKPGGLTSMDNKPLFDSIPSNVEGFVGRQQEMYEIINLLEENRLVSILGPPGIGKTSISRNLANYLRDRKKFSDGIIYVGLRG